ncbi:3891_t:CDS:2 [Paraglomus occultum]|uniref:3891_t:CDS:1 n=1 Tax=Paraglomus occultum TaxID=144539 RepID=A0A9N9BBI5_9GLOM|nr:3891_t:CDS:2 [Paraglomus occultum]
MTQNKGFQKYLQEIESSDYDGPDISQALPANASPIDKAKYKKYLLPKKKTRYMPELFKFVEEKEADKERR